MATLFLNAEREMDEWALASGVSKGPCCPAESEAPTWNAATAANSPLHDESVSPLFPRDFVPPPLPDSADPSTRSSASSPAAEALALGFLRDASGAFIAPKEWIDAADSFKAPSGVSDRATYARAARAYKARRADLVSMNAKLDSVRSRIAVLRSCQEGAAAKELFELVRPAVRRIEAAASKLHGELQATRRRVDAFKRLLG